MSDHQHDDDLRNAQPMKRLSEEWWAARAPEVRARRCHAHRRNCNQCGKVAMAGQQVCGTHGGRAPQAIAKARRRLDEAADRMAQRLLGIAESDNVPAYVALAAVDSALDRAGLKPTQQVSVGVTAPWEEVITGIAQISQAESRARRGITEPTTPPQAALSPPGDGDILDAEVVEDSPSGPPNARTGGDRGDVPAQPGSGLQTMEDALDDLRRQQRRRW